MFLRNPKQLSEDVRSAAVDAIPELLKSIKAAMATGAATPQARPQKEFFIDNLLV